MTANQRNRNLRSALKSAAPNRKFKSTSKPSVSTNYTKNKNSVFVWFFKAINYQFIIKSKHFLIFT